ncbi:MAG: alanine racemase [Holosporaceae bacterium]|jgi:alanine racemase|nr:alanine racemase [Holosporaceae bacterium]
MNNEFSKILSGVKPYILSVAVVNLDNVVKNYEKIKGQLPEKTQIFAVLKADAYGFGAIPISERLYSEGCRGFLVATVEEGLEIRKNLPHDAHIFILSGLFADTEDIFIRHKLTPVLNNKYQSDLWINYAKKLNKKLDAVLHVDTGISRNGAIFREVQDNFHGIRDNLNLVFVMSHLACADTPDHPLNKLQLKRFKDIMQIFKGVKGCLSATNGMFLGEDYFFDIVRPGKALYGFSVREDKVGSMTPVMDIFSRIVQINYLKAGDSVGYGATFTADRDVTAITIGMGYADGFMRKFSGFGHGFLGRKKIPMIGRISMDYIVLDASEVEESQLKLGNWVALTNDDDYTLEKWSLELNTIPHEIACRFGSRVKKIYVGDKSAR